MPLKVEYRRNKEKLGLEIFDIKKELGFGCISKTNLTTVEK